MLLILAYLTAAVALGWSLVADIARMAGSGYRAPWWVHLGSLCATIWFLAFIIRSLWLRRI